MSPSGHDDCEFMEKGTKLQFYFMEGHSSHFITIKMATEPSPKARFQIELIHAN